MIKDILKHDAGLFPNPSIQFPLNRRRRSVINCSYVGVFEFEANSIDKKHEFPTNSKITAYSGEVV